MVLFYCLWTRVVIYKRIVLFLHRLTLMWQRSKMFVWSAVRELLLWCSRTMYLIINPKPVCRCSARRISGVRQRSISDISLMCFEKHTCILRKHSARLELISLISLQLSYRPQRAVCQASAISHSQKICALYSECRISRKLPDVFVLLVSRRNCVLSLQSVWLNVKGQVLEFGRRTKSTIGNLTFS